MPLSKTDSNRLEERRHTRRASRRERTREEILGAARTVLLEKGVGGTTLEAVANEAGMSKTALYYYFPSKDALLFDLIHANFAAFAEDIHRAVELQPTGQDALRTLIGTTVRRYAPNLDDFRLAYLQGQVAGHGAVRVGEEQMARIRPLNELTYAGTAERVAAAGPNRAGVDPRLMAFLAHMAAIGVLTMKGMVESVDDPLAYTDDQLIDALGAIFAAASAPQ